MSHRLEKNSEKEKYTMAPSQRFANHPGAKEATGDAFDYNPEAGQNPVVRGLPLVLFSNLFVFPHFPTIRVVTYPSQARLILTFICACQDLELGVRSTVFLEKCQFWQYQIDPRSW